MPRRRAGQAAVAAILGAVLIIKFFPRRSAPSAGPVRMQFTYPITYLDPTLYDDWETVFIGNHIYRRLLAEDDKPQVPYLAQDISVSCAEPTSSDVGPSCRRLRVAFTPEPFLDCAGNSYQIEEIRREFEALLRAKAWALPDWRRCEAAGQTICITAKNTGDVQRRLRNVNFRFGWSKRTASDSVFGAGPYCLHATFGPRRAIEKGALLPSDQGAGLPRIEFSVGDDKDWNFDVALYGTRELIKGTRRNVQAHTPLAYYVVTNRAFFDRSLPWNSESTRRIIHDHFVKTGVFFSETTGIEKLVPPGAALQEAEPKRAAGGALQLALPDYLPGCPELAASLTASWAHDGSAKASCTNIVTFIQSRVREKTGNWSGFLVGLSPADPGRDAIRLQYFSKDSPDSLTYDFQNPERLFYLAGIGQSLVTVDGKRVCDLRPSTLGLGDIFVTDFLPCGE